MTETPDTILDFEQLARQVAALDDPIELMEQSYIVLTQLLRRAEDGALLDQLSIMLGEIVGDLPFDALEHDLRRHTRAAAARCVEVLEAARDRRLPREQPISTAPDVPKPRPDDVATARTEVDEVEWEPEPEPEPQRDLEYYLPPHLEHLLKHIEYDQPTPLPPTGNFASFDDLCLAALNHRLDLVFVFFHKRNPAVTRLLPPPFLLSPEFAERFKLAVATLIFPKIRASRQLRLLASNIDIASTTSETFWQHINESMGRLLQLTWNTAWNDLRLIEEVRNDEKVMKVKDEVKALRKVLQPPNPECYDLPHVANREIELFKSLLSTTIDWWPPLSEFWWICHTLYEQEWDPRVFQQQAREGALRDKLLNGFNAFPEPWHDFLLLMMHRIFPRIGTRFLERFVYNLGQSEEAREVRMPYLMREIKQARSRPDIRKQEHLDEENWRHQVKTLNDYLKGLTTEPR
jgi:hypothetical protein